MLRRTRVARLGACPEAVEVEGLLLQVEAQSVEVVVPIGVFDDDLHLRVDGLGRVDHQLASGIGHQAQAVFGPASGAFCRNLVVVLQVDEEEVVEDEVVEEPGGIFRHLAHLLALVFACIAVGLEVGGFRTGVGDAAAHLQALGEEKLLHLLHGLFVHREGIAVRFEVDLVQVHLRAHGLPGFVQELVVSHPGHVLGADVGRYLEVLVLASLCWSAQGNQRDCEAQHFHQIVFHIFSYKKEDGLR